MTHVAVWAVPGHLQFAPLSGKFIRRVVPRLRAVSAAREAMCWLFASKQQVKLTAPSAGEVDAQ
jgi:hypothetical protein